jgi:hypothetical protein
LFDQYGNYVGVSGIGSIYFFEANGKWGQVIVSSGSGLRVEAYRQGKFRTKGNSIECFSTTYESYMNGRVSTQRHPVDNFSFDYRLGSDEKGDYFMNNYNADGTRKPITDDDVKWRRVLDK